MAVVTITITDDEVGGGCQIQASSIPEIPDDEALCTGAQIAGAMVMKVMDLMVQQAIIGGGSGE